MTAVAEDLVLDPASAFVDLLVGELHQMKRVRDLVGPGQSRVKYLAVRARKVEGGVENVEAPVTGARVQSGNGFMAIAIRHDVEQLTVGDVHDRGAKALAAKLAFTHEERLIETKCLDEAEAFRVIINQGLAVA